MAAFWNSFLAICLVELTDRTRLIALLLSARFNAPGALILGMTAGYLIPLGLAAYGADFIVRLLPPPAIRSIVAVSFVGFGAWLLLEREEEQAQGAALPGRWRRWERWGPLLSGFVLVSLTEFADKSQIATAVLAVRLQSVLAVFLGAVAAQAFLNVLYVFLGRWLAQRIPEREIRRVAGASFIAIGAFSALLG